MTGTAAPHRRLGVPGLGPCPLQRLGITDRYGNMHLLAQNLALMCHGVCGCWEEGVLSISIKTFSLPGNFSLLDEWSQCPGEKIWVNVLPFHPTTSLPPPPLADHVPRSPHLCVILRECGPKAQVGCVKGCPTDGWNRAGQGEEPSLPSLSCLEGPLWPGA